VEAGQTDLGALGFWELVERVKRDPGLVERFADRVGRIDREVFERGVRPRFRLWLGDLVLVAGTLLFAVLVAGALGLVHGNRFIYGPFEPRGTSADATVAGALLIVAAGGLSVTVHDLGHRVMGRLQGIGFLGYFLDGPFRIQPGLKIDYASYLRARPEKRVGMHAAGALASKAAPFAVFAAAYIPHAASNWNLFPAWSLWAVLGIGVGQIVTDVVWSRTRSDWKKVRRERMVVRDLAA